MAGLALKITVGIIAAVLIAAAAAQASTVFAPLALAMFIVAIVWPLQHRLQARMPKLLALAITMVVTAARMKWTTEPTIRNAMMMPPAMAAILNQLIRHPLDKPPETSSHLRYYLTGRVPPRDANTMRPLL